MSSILTDKGTAPGVAFGTDPKAFQPSQRERELRDWLLVDVLGSAAYKDHARWVLDKGIIDGFELPIGQVIGFSQFAPQESTVPSVAGESTASDTYVDLTTVGPTVSGLPSGVYVVYFGGIGVNSLAAGGAIMSVSVNGAAASDDDLIVNNGVDQASISRAVKKTLSTGNNSVKIKYRRGSAAGTATFYRRWMVVQRVSNV